MKRYIYINIYIQSPYSKREEQKNTIFTAANKWLKKYLHFIISSLKGWHGYHPCLHSDSTWNIPKKTHDWPGDARSTCETTVGLQSICIWGAVGTRGRAGGALTHLRRYWVLIKQNKMQSCHLSSALCHSQPRRVLSADKDFIGSDWEGNLSQPPKSS